MILLLINLSNAATYYIDSQMGSDSNNGLSITTPIKTIAALSTKTLLPGDFVLFKRGCTWKEMYTVKNSGTSTSPITFSAYGTGNLPVIDAELIRTHGFYLSGNSYVTIKNINVINQGDAGGIRIIRCKNITVDSCFFYVTDQGGVFIENSSDCYVGHSSITTPSDTTDKQTDGIYSQRNNRITFDGNKILITNQAPIQHIDGIQSYLDTSLTMCNNNIEQRNFKTGYAQGIYITTGAGTFLVYNNVINCPNALSHTLGFRNLTTGTGAIRAYNNTCINAGSNAIRVSETGDMVIKNNILISTKTNSSLYIDNTVNNPADIDYNLYYSSGTTRAVYYVPAGGYQTLAQWQALGFDLHGKSTNPMLNSDFSLQQTSPAIDAGLDVSSILSSDINGVSRPQLKADDIGAYEYKSTTGVLPVELTSFTGNFSGKNVTLYWSTASENNNYGFYIERKTTGTFEQIGFAAGFGDSNIKHDYIYKDKSVHFKSAAYRLKQVDKDGSFKYSPEIQVNSIIIGYSLSDNYPNPFNPTTQMNYSISSDGQVNLSVFNITGQRVAVLDNQYREAGAYSVSWNAIDFASGVYLVRIVVKGANGELMFTDSKKLNLIK